MDIRDKILSQSYAEFILPLNKPTNYLMERYRAEFFQSIGESYSTIFVPLEKTDNFNFSNYEYTMFPKIYGLMDLNPLDESGITALAKHPVLGLRGQGVIIGIIDTGIDYTNPVFLDEAGKTRILRIWDQTDNSGRLPLVYGDEIFYGTEYMDDEIDMALASDDPYSIVKQRDTNGHGTFLAGVAAGTPNEENKFSGAATEAKLVVVKLKEAKNYLREFYFIPEDVPAYQENDIMIAASYVRACGRLFNMPVVLLVGMGSSQGSHIGRLPLSNELNDFRSTLGAVVVSAAGNEGNARHHYRGMVENMEEPDEMEIRVGDNVAGFSAEIWMTAPQLFSVGFVSPTGEVIDRIPARLGTSQTIDFLFENTRVYVDYDIVEPTTGQELIFIRFQNPTRGIWRVRVYGVYIEDKRFDCWLPITQFIGEDTYFLKPDPSVTITSPGMTDNVITISGYDSRSGAFFIDSGRGYTAANAIKPDVAAPAVNITGPTLRGGFENRSGTSCAAAITAGACAQFLSWSVISGRLSWATTANVKSYIIRGAVREDEINYPNNTWGYGKLNIYNAFETLRK